MSSQYMSHTLCLALRQPRTAAAPSGARSPGRMTCQPAGAPRWSQNAGRWSSQGHSQRLSRHPGTQGSLRQATALCWHPLLQPACGHPMLKQQWSGMWQSRPGSRPRQTLLKPPEALHYKILGCPGMLFAGDMQRLQSETTPNGKSLCMKAKSTCRSV